MEMWILNLIIALLVPVFIIIYCSIYRNKAPQDINGSNGYKTAMSRLNRDTWEFANHYYNKRMRVAGWIMLIISIAAMLFTRGKGEPTASICTPILLGIQLAVLLIAVIPTEIALRKTFDENGNRK